MNEIETGDLVEIIDANNHLHGSFFVVCGKSNLEPVSIHVRNIVTGNELKTRQLLRKVSKEYVKEQLDKRVIMIQRSLLETTTAITRL